MLVVKLFGVQLLIDYLFNELSSIIISSELRKKLKNILCIFIV